MGCKVPSALARPSMVVIFAPSTCAAKTLHDLRLLPSTRTVQAPHCAVSQPTCVPVKCKVSLKACTNKVLAATSSSTALLFTVNVKCIIFLQWFFNQIPPLIIQTNLNHSPRFYPCFSQIPAQNCFKKKCLQRKRTDGRADAWVLQTILHEI